MSDFFNLFVHKNCALHVYERTESRTDALLDHLPEHVLRLVGSQPGQRAMTVS